MTTENGEVYLCNKRDNVAGPGGKRRRMRETEDKCVSIKGKSWYAVVRNVLEAWN